VFACTFDMCIRLLLIYLRSFFNERFVNIWNSLPADADFSSLARFNYPTPTHKQLEFSEFRYLSSVSWPIKLGLVSCLVFKGNYQCNFVYALFSALTV